MADRTNEPRIDAEEILAGIVRWVEIETPSTDGAAVNRLADAVEREFADLGAAIERIPGRDGFGDALIARAPWNAEADGPGIMVLGHLDTVHPHGTIARLAVRREGDRVYGPGIYDMKGGDYLGLYALRHLLRQGRRAKLPVTFLFVPEEEVGSPTSRPVIEREALKSKYVLCMEPGRDGGKVVTGRKGCARYVVRVHGEPAHSGARHQDGRSAIREAARQILAIEAMTDYGTGVTTSVGLWGGGTGANVVPEFSTFEVDVRLPDAATAAAVCARIEALKPVDPDVAITVEGGLNRPAYEKTDAIATLHAHAQTLAAEIGIPLPDTTTGGFSDGNFTAALGIPTLDGLGVDGAGAHTEEEHLYYSSLEPRAKLLIRLLETLE
ncbi:MAG: M20 family metallopeptidase [Alphaproteobacteria bacterium]